MSGASQAFTGWMAPSDHSRLHTLIRFIIQQEIGLLRTSVPVKVLKVHGGGVGGAPPTVDLQIMVKQTDSIGNTSSHSTVYGIPVARNQGGTSAVVNDPVAGDFGHMVVNDRDISSVKANSGAESNPGSYRRHDLADGVYYPAILNKAALKQYLQFMSNGIQLLDTNSNLHLMDTNGITLVPGSKNVLLGAKSGLANVLTTAGPSVNVLAKVG